MTVNTGLLGESGRITKGGQTRSPSKAREVQAFRPSLSLDLRRPQFRLCESRTKARCALVLHRYLYWTGHADRSPGSSTFEEFPLNRGGFPLSLREIV